MANSINNFFKSFLTKKSDSVIGIDIGSASIKVVQLKKKKGKAILETYGEIALGPYAETEVGRATKLTTEKITEALNDVLKESNASTVDCALSIPMRSSMVSIIKMPDMEEKQMSQMVPIEARKYIPVPISEVTLDWFLIPKLDNVDDIEYRQQLDPGEVKIKEAKGNEVLVVAIHNDVLNNYSSIVTQAQLNASFFEIEMFSTLRSVLEHGDNTSVMIFDMGASVTKLYIAERGIIRDSHIINKGSQDITLNISKSMGVSVDFAEKLKRNFGRNEKQQDENINKVADLVLSPIFSEVNSVVVNYGKKYNKNISKVIMVGGGSLLNGIIPTASNKLGIEVVPGDPFAKVQTPAFLQNVLQKTGLAFSTSIGLAMRKLQELD